MREVDSIHFCKNRVCPANRMAAMHVVTKKMSDSSDP